MNAIVVLAIGAKYEKVLNETLPQLSAYATRCNASLEICRNAPDPSARGPLLTQKLLIPKLYERYKWIAFLDLDIAISKNAPSIFDALDPKKGFGAVLDPRGQAKFNLINKIWFKHPNPEIQTPEWYFKEYGFSSNSKILGSINGGVWLAQPKLIGDLFANYYWGKDQSNSSQTMYEEAPMAHLSQVNDLFFKIDEKFNQQLIYLIADKDPEKNIRIAKLQQLVNRPLNKLFPNRTSQFMIKSYIDFVDNNLAENYILHFSGKFPIPAKLKNLISD
jgi:hypothetical protein